MIFNQLCDLVYNIKSSLSFELCELLLKILGNNEILTIPNNVQPKPILNNTFTVNMVYEPNSSNQLSDINFLLENILKNDLTKYIEIKTSLIEFCFINSQNLNIGEFTIINKEYYNTFEVCHQLNIYKYLMVIYFLDDNSIITFFNTYILNPNKGDVIIFPIAWFFVYKITKKQQNLNNIYIFNNIIKRYRN